MMLNDVSKMGKYQNDIQKNFRMWIEILSTCDSETSEFKYAIDMFRSHVDHMRYLQYESNENRKPVEVAQSIVEAIS
jgi:hypothetical protein